MDEIYYYTSTSGRIVFVKFNKIGNYQWTNQKMSVKRDSIHDLRPFSQLVGRKIRLGNNEGIITDCHPYDLPLEGKHIGLGKYLSHKKYLNMNNLVAIHWTKGHAHTWQPFILK